MLSAAPENQATVATAGGAQYRARQFLAIAHNEVLALRRDVLPFMLVIVMPLVFTVFVAPLYKEFLQADGYHGASGYELALPSMAVMFSFFLIGSTAYSVYREYTYGTWTQLNASGVPVGLVICAKVCPIIVVGIAQQLFLVLGGALVLGVDLHGQIWELAAVAACASVAVVGLGLAVLGVSRTSRQVQLAQTLSATVLAGIGGAIAPPQLLPTWVRAIGRISPAYWSLGAYRHIILGEMTSIGLSCLALLAFGIGGLLLAVRLVRLEEVREPWV